MCIVLHGNYLAVEKWKYVVTIAKSFYILRYIYMNGIENDRFTAKINLKCWFIENNESFAEGFSVITGYITQNLK